MEIEIGKRGDVAVLRCKGSMDADNITYFKKKAYDLFDSGTNKFILDASNMDFIDSIGLGVLISLLRKVRQQNGDVKISSLSSEVKTIFEITRLHRLFDVFDTTKEAVSKFKTGD